MVEDSLGFRIFVPVVLVLVILLGGPIGALLFERRYGFDPLEMEDPEPLLAFGERVRDVLFLIVLALTTTNVFWPEVKAHVGTLPALVHPAVQATGAVLMVAALFVVRIAQIQMRSSWRHGLDRAHPPDELITDGFFALSRNPIYLGMLALAVGVFLCLPDAVTLTVAVVAYVLLHTRIHVEEAFLSELYGVEYDAYRRRTPRWLFFPGG